MRHFVDLPPVCPSARSGGQVRLWCRKARDGHRRWRKVLSSLMEGTVTGRKAEESRYPTVEFAVRAVAGWIKKHRIMNGARDELEQCGSQDALQIAKDLGVPVRDLRTFAAKGTGAANALPKMLSAIAVNAQALTNGDPAVMRDLQRTCILCDHKSRCQRELAEGTAARHFREFCPNAYTFDALTQKLKPPCVDASL